MKLTELVDKINSDLIKIDRISKGHLSGFNGKSFNNNPEILGVLILERLIGNLYSTRILLTELTERPEIENSIGIILRNNLTLCKIVFKHYELQENDGDLDHFYRDVFGENIQRTVQFLKKTNSEKVINLELGKIKENFSFLLKNIQLDLDNIDNMKFRTKFNLSNHFQSLENLFVAYSKYEHFGLNTLILQHNSNTADKLDRMKIAFHYSLQGVIICLSMLNVFDENLKTINKWYAKN